MFVSTASRSLTGAVNLKGIITGLIKLWVLVYPCLVITTVNAQSSELSPVPLSSPASFLELTLEPQSSEITAADAVELLLAQIKIIEAEKSSFAPELGELSYDLGIQLDQLGLHESALDAFMRADQNMKIREGLYSPNREALISKIFEQHVALNDWESAEIALDSNAWLRARNVDASSLAYVEVLQELVRWNLARDHYGVEEEESRSLFRAYADLEEIFDIYDEHELPLDDITLDLAMTLNHMLSLEVLVLDEVRDRGGSAALNRTYFRQARAATSACLSLDSEDIEVKARCAELAERQIRDDLPEEIYIDYSSGQFDQSLSVYSRSYFRGKDILLNQLDILRQTDQNPRTLDTLLKLGDWYLLFGDQRNAEEVYATAWQYAQEIGMGDSIHMQEPRAISTAGLIESLPKLVIGNRNGEAEVAVTIAKNGEIERIEYLDIDIDDEDAIAKLSATLASSRYRPILRNGVPIAAVAYTVSKQVSY